MNKQVIRIGDEWIDFKKLTKVKDYKNMPLRMFFCSELVGVKNDKVFVFLDEYTPVGMGQYCISVESGILFLHSCSVIKGEWGGYSVCSFLSGREDVKFRQIFKHILEPLKINSELDNFREPYINIVEYRISK